jgi:hypothetical protein
VKRRIYCTKVSIDTLVLGGPLSSVSDKDNNQALRVVIVALKRTAVDLQCLEDEVKAELRRQSMKAKEEAKPATRTNTTPKNK